MSTFQKNHGILDCSGLRAMLAELPREAFVIGLFMHSVDVSQDEWLNPLAACLRKRGFVTVGIRTPHSLDKCDLGQAEFQALLETGEVRGMERINVFIISDMDCLAAHFPQASKVLGCRHAFDLAYTTSMPYQTHQAALFDGWIGPPLNDESRIRIESLWGKLINRGAARRKGRFFHIIPSGYPRLATLARDIRSMDTPPDSIVYAPIGMNSNRELGGNRLEAYGKRIIRALLSSFPEMNVIFRPYKNDLESREVAKIRAAFANEKRFILDGSPGRLSAFSRSAVLITDISHAAKTFAFAALRPAIYFHPWEKSKTIGEWPGGHTLGTFTSLVQTIRNYLENMDAWENKIRSARDKLAGPIDNGLDAIAGWIEDFYHDRPHPDWLSLERSGNAEPLAETEIISRTFREAGPAWANIAATAAAYGNPDNPLLLAFALHMGLWKLPASHIVLYTQLKNMISGLLGKPFDCVKYDELDIEDVRRLYSLGLRDMFRKNDAAGVDAAQTLLDNFNKYFPERNMAVSKPQRADAMQRKALDTGQLLAFMDSLPKETFVVGLFIDQVYAAQYEWLDALAAHIKAKGHMPIAVCTDRDADACRFKNVDCFAVIPRERARDLGRVNVFVMSDVNCAQDIFPPNSKILACVHAFYHNHSSTSFPTSIQMAISSDGWMVPMRLNAETREMTKRLWTGFLNPKHCFRKSPKFQIIPAGYPRLAAMNEELKKISTKPDSIVYAPYKMAFALDQGGERVKKHGLRIIQTLLDNFPEYNVIFRPMPGFDRDNPASEEILAFFKNEPRFIFDESSAQLPSFSRGAVVITDISNVVKSFAFLTLRPGIFFRPWEKGGRSPQRWDGGFEANTYPALIAAVRASIDNITEESEIIRGNRDRMIMPFDNALEEIADWLPDFCTGKSRDEWLVIDRCQDAPVLSDYDIISKCGLSQTGNPFIKPILSSVAAIFNDPDNPLLAAYALHQGLMHVPSAQLILGLHEIAGNLLGKQIPPVSYKQIAPEDTQRLYDMALMEKISRNDNRGIALVERLLREFNELCGAVAKNNDTGQPSDQSPSAN